ncbi:MAG TPA: rRNA maturation RNase YbeY [Elusimicrobiota bacterium]|nr:rRNA maturation RNase YbeY [Elusimicrobiota bacterium]
MTVRQARLAFTLLRTVRLPRRVIGPAELEALAGFTLRCEKVAGACELTLDLTNHSRIQALNRRFRGVDRTTDVMAFRYHSRPHLQGDIAINVQQAKAQAAKFNNPLPREIRLLLIHGILHLLDYTDYDPAPRRRMFKRQNAILRRWERRDAP